METKGYTSGVSLSNPFGTSMNSNGNRFLFVQGKSAYAQCTFTSNKFSINLLLTTTSLITDARYLTIQLWEDIQRKTKQKSV